MIRTGNERKGNRLFDIPVAAGEKLIEGTMAVINADGYAQSARAGGAYRGWMCPDLL